MEKKRAAKFARPRRSDKNARVNGPFSKSALEKNPKLTQKKCPNKWKKTMRTTRKKMRQQHKKTGKGINNKWSGKII